MEPSVERLLCQALGEMNYLGNDISGMKSSHEDPLHVGFAWKEHAGHVDYQFEKVQNLLSTALEQLRKAKNILGDRL